MKKILFCILFTFIVICPVYAEEQANTQDTTDWGYYADLYDKAGLSKPVSQEEFDKAIETVKKYQKSKTKTKDKGKDKNTSKKPQKGRMMNNKPVVYDIPAYSDPLLRLPVDVIYEDNIIPTGFYLVEKIKDNDKYILRLKQENKPIADIEATKTSNPEEIIQQSSVGTEIIDKEHIKINYKSGSISLEAILYISY